MTRAVGWTFVAVLVVLGLFPLPAPAADDTAPSASTSTVITDTVESWWATPQISSGVATPVPVAPVDVPPDTCTLPTGCLPVETPTEVPPQVPVEPSAGAAYPTGTLHVESNAGSTTGRTYLAPDFASLPTGSVVTAATLTLPVNDDVQSGNRMLASSEMVACLTTEAVLDDVYGAVLAPPGYACKKVKVPAAYDAKAGEFTVDLMPFVTAWTKGAPFFGVALVPDPTSESTGSWHVALNGADVSLGRSITTDVTYRPTATDEPTPEPTPTPTPAPAPPPVGSGLTTPPGSSVVEPPVAEPPAVVPATEAPVAAAVPAPLAAAPAAFLNQPWYSYRGVVFLPLAFLVAMVLTGRSLTRPLTLAVARRSGWRGAGR